MTGLFRELGQMAEVALSSSGEDNGDPGKKENEARMFVSTAKSLRSLDSGGVPLAWFSEPSRRCEFDIGSEFHDGCAFGALRPNFRGRAQGQGNRVVGVTLSGT